MKLPQIASFSLWSLTAFALTGFLLALRTPSLEPLNHMVELDTVSHAQSNVISLLQAAAAQPTTVTAVTPTLGNSSLQLLGIVFSTLPSQSRAVLQGSDGVSRQFVIGSTLPNSAQLVDIAKRQITYELNGIQTQLTLPQR